MLSKEQIDQLEKNVQAIANGKHREEIASAFEMARGALRIDEHLAEQQQKFTAAVSSSGTEKTRVRDLEKVLARSQERSAARADLLREVIDFGLLDFSDARIEQTRGVIRRMREELDRG